MPVDVTTYQRKAHSMALQMAGAALKTVVFTHADKSESTASGITLTDNTTLEIVSGQRREARRITLEMDYDCGAIRGDTALLDGMEYAVTEIDDKTTCAIIHICGYVSMTVTGNKTFENAK